MLMLLLAVALPLITQDTPERHVRATEPAILALIDAGLSRSATFRDLIATLNGSDVIVYVEPKLTRPNLGGYLSHQIAAQGDHRYLRIAIDMRGSQNRLVRLLAHELQHAVEVAQMPDARDAAGLRRAFATLAVPLYCGGMCFETQRALDVERTVIGELKTNRTTARGAK